MSESLSADQELCALCLHAPASDRAQIASDVELSLAAARLLAAEADKPGLAARRMGSKPSLARWAGRKLALLLQLEGLPGAGDSVNARLLAAGLARVAPPRGRAVRCLPRALFERAAPGQLCSGLPVRARRASGVPELNHTWKPQHLHDGLPPVAWCRHELHHHLELSRVRHHTCFFPDCLWSNGWLGRRGERLCAHAAPGGR